MVFPAPVEKIFTPTCDSAARSTSANFTSSSTWRSCEIGTSIEFTTSLEYTDAIFSTTAGLLESTLVNGFWTLMRIDLPTSTCTVSPSAGATGCDVSWPTALLPITKTNNAILAKLELIIWSPVPSGLHQIYEPYV